MFIEVQVFIGGTMIFIDKQDIVDILEQVDFVDEPKVPFPQADTFTRIICICEHLLNGDMSANDIVELNKFTKRQKDYYANAGIYLSLIEKYKKGNKIFYKLSDRGRIIFGLDEYERDLELCRCLFEHTVFHNVFSVYLINGDITLEEIIEIMNNHALYNINNPQIFKRRGKTVLRWIKWVSSHFE